MLRLIAVAFSLALLAAAPAASAPTYHYRVTGGTMLIETVLEHEPGAEEYGVERLTWTVAPHARGTRPAPGFPSADGSGGLRNFQLRFPVRGTYAYDYEEDDIGKCQETFALAPASRGTVTARQVGSKIRISWGLDPRRRRGYLPHQCRPPTNNALLYFLANQPSTIVNVASSAFEKATFTVTARGSQTRAATTLQWRLTLSVRRLGSR